MAEPTGTDIVKTALSYLVTGGGAAVIGAFVNGLIRGTPGQEKELREAYAEEVKGLREEVRKVKVEHAAEIKTLRDEMEDLRDEIDQMRVKNSRLYGERETARFLANKLERDHNLQVTIWPADPPASGGTL